MTLGLKTPHESGDELQKQKIDKVCFHKALCDGHMLLCGIRETFTPEQTFFGHALQYHQFCLFKTTAAGLDQT